MTSGGSDRRIRPALPDHGAVEAAAERIRPRAPRTPMLESPLLDRCLGGRLLIKAEVLQRTGSFKFRGACNRIGRLSDDERAGWRGDLLVRQSRPGGGAGGPDSRCAGDRRHARGRPCRQTTEHAGPRRRRRRLRPRAGRSAGDRPRPRGADGTGAGRTVRRRGRHRRTGHGRPRDRGAGRRPRMPSRCRRGARRRRRADRRNRPRPRREGKRTFPSSASSRRPSTTPAARSSRAGGRPTLRGAARSATRWRFPRPGR